MGKNAYAQKIKARKELGEYILKRWTCQLCLDAMSLALNDPEIMGKDTFGRERLTRLGEGFNKYFDEIYPALTKNEKASYLRAVVDRRLHQILGDDFLAWEERYEYWNDREI